jgi:hypothetical protein
VYLVAVLALAVLAVLLVFAFEAWSLRSRGLRVRPWPFALIGLAFVGFFAWLFLPAISIWLANR